MKRRLFLALGIVALMTIVVTGVISAVAAGNTVPATRLGDSSQSVTANSLKPSQCSALNLTNIVVCPTTGGTCRGTNANDLILGSPNADNINGRQGNDCIVGGGGNDTINGGAGTDVCIGGAGTDTFTNCETTVQ
jgi:Ca2+-binding RTX toxin-like protein